MTKELTPHQVQMGKVIDYYNHAQKFYERVWYWGNKGLGLHYGLWTEGVRNRIQAIERENEILADLADVKEGDIVADTGCGVGGSGIWLAENRGARVVGLNIVRKQLKKGVNLASQKAVEDKLDFLEADYHWLPLSSESIDVVWSLESIEHSDDPERFINEAIRVLKPGGRIVIAGTFKGNKEATEEQKVQLQVGFEAAGAFNDFRSADNIAQLMIKSGFSNIQNWDTTHLIMKSARQMRDMCRWGLPFAKFGNRQMNGFVSQIMEDNTAWGTYQEGLFRDCVTSYNILVGVKQ